MKKKFSSFLLLLNALELINNISSELEPFQIAVLKCGSKYRPKPYNLDAFELKPSKNNGSKMYHDF